MGDAGPVERGDLRPDRRQHLVGEVAGVDLVEGRAGRALGWPARRRRRRSRPRRAPRARWRRRPARGAWPGPRAGRPARATNPAGRRRSRDTRRALTARKNRSASRASRSTTSTDRSMPSLATTNPVPSAVRSIESTARPARSQGRRHIPPASPAGGRAEGDQHQRPDRDAEQDRGRQLQGEGDGGQDAEQRRRGQGPPRHPSPLAGQVRHQHRDDGGQPGQVGRRGERGPREPGGGVEASERLGWRALVEPALGERGQAAGHDGGHRQGQPRAAATGSRSARRAGPADRAPRHSWATPAATCSTGSGSRAASRARSRDSSWMSPGSATVRPSTRARPIRAATRRARSAGWRTQRLRRRRRRRGGRHGWLSGRGAASEVKMFSPSRSASSRVSSWPRTLFPCASSGGA